MSSKHLFKKSSRIYNVSKTPMQYDRHRGQIDLDSLCTGFKEKVNLNRLRKMVKTQKAGKIQEGIVGRISWIQNILVELLHSREHSKPKVIHILFNLRP